MRTADDIDISNLVFMRQEEKLAADVYRALGAKWDHPAFSNIEESELFHQAEVVAQLARFGIEDPIAHLGPGEFDDPAMAEMYRSFVARGLESLDEAMRVAGHIEELDIADLRARRCGVPEIDRLYDLLELGSHNHLRAFVINLAYMGHPYRPQVLTPQEVVDILTAGAGGCNSQACHGAAGADHHGGGHSCVPTDGGCH